MRVKVCDLVQKNQKQKSHDIKTGKLTCGVLIVI